MKIGKKAFKTTLLSLIMLVCGLGNAQAADPLLDMLPGDALFCVRINDLSGSLAKMDQYLVGVSPIGMAMMANMQLAGITGDPMLTGIEMNGSFAVVGLPDFTNGILVPVTDFDEFVKTNPNCTEGEDGVTILSAPNSPMGALAMTSVADGKYALVVWQGQKDILPGLKAALTNPASALVARLSEMQAQEAVAAPAWGYVNLAALYDQFSPLVMGEMQKAEEEMSTAMAGSGMGEFGAFYVKMYMELFKQFAGQADSATLAITPDPASLTLDISLRAKDGSDLAQMMVADPTAKQGFKYTGYLDSSNAVNGLMKWNPVSMQKMYDTIFDVMAAAKPDASMNASITQMKDITHQWMPLMGDEIAFSFNYAKGKPPFRLREVFGVRDSAKAEALMDQSMGLASDFYAAIGLPMTLSYQPDTATYKNAKIDKITLSFPTSNDPNDIMGTMMSTIYGEGLTYTAAHTDNAVFVTMGEDSEADVKTLIDQNPSVAATGEVKAALDTFKGTPYNECVASINVIKLMTGMGDMLQSMGPAIAQMEGEGGQAPPPFELFSGLNLPSQSSLAIGGYSADGQTTMRLVLPKQHLMEIMNAVMQIQQKVMQQTQQPEQEPEPAQPMP
jgi:hypothetical protein